VIAQERVRRLLVLGVFVLSIGLALINPFLAMAVWFVGWLPFYLGPAAGWSPKKRIEQRRR
jgi:hypothetical protein